MLSFFLRQQLYFFSCHVLFCFYSPIGELLSEATNSYHVLWCLGSTRPGQARQGWHNDGTSSSSGPWCSLSCPCVFRWIIGLCPCQWYLYCHTLAISWKLNSWDPAVSALHCTWTCFQGGSLMEAKGQNSSLHEFMSSEVVQGLSQTPTGEVQADFLPLSHSKECWARLLL